MIKKLKAIGRVITRKIERLVLIVVLGLGIGTAVLIGVNVFQAQSIVYNFEIEGEIEATIPMRLKFMVMETVLRVVSDSNDVVIFTINSPGGLALMALDLIHDIEMSNAHTISYTPKFAASAAALIAFSTNEVHMTDKTIYLFHRAYIPLPDGTKFRVPFGQVAQSDIPDQLIYRKVFQYMTLEQQAGYMNGDDIIVSSIQIITMGQLQQGSTK